MKTIKIGFTTSFYDKGEVLNLLQHKFNVKVLLDGYDYFFADDLIYYPSNNDDFNKLVNMNPATIRIFFTGEAVYPDLNLFDYARCFDDFDTNRILPFVYIKYQHSKAQTAYGWEAIDAVKNCANIKAMLHNKTKFCNFIYSNALAHPMRDKLFYALSKYKKVDALGTHLKNVEIKNTRYDSNWKKISVELKKPYKFSIAAENAQFKGYTSEKIITSMLANTIPIYFGDPDVAKLFNPKSFINVGDYACLEDVVKRIKEIDTNDDLYLEMISQPWRTREQIEQCEKNYGEYLKRFYHIFEQDFEKAHRRPQGCWADVLYPNFFKSFNSCGDNHSKKSFKIKNSLSKRLKIFSRGDRNENL